MELSNSLILQLSKKISEIEKGEILPEALISSGKQNGYYTETPVIGICGSAGSGKSTLIDALINHCFFSTKSVCILACDPAEPDGGSILGDIFRIGSAGKNNVFFRSFPLKETGISVPPFIVEVISLCEKSGFDYIFVETQGSAQAHYDIYYITDFLIYVSDPLSGDDLQSIKRGIHHYSNVIFVNKSDIEKVAPIPISGKKIIYGSALNKKGIDDLISEIKKATENQSFKKEREHKRRKWLSIVLKEAFLKFIEKHLENTCTDSLAYYYPYFFAMRMLKNLLK